MVSLIVLVSSCSFDKTIKKKHLTKLLQPTGPYAIGTTSYHLIDPTRNDPHAPHNKRELMVQVWHPAEKNDLPKALYIPSEKVKNIFKNDLKDIFKAQDQDLIVFDTLKTHATANAPIAQEKAQYPVIIFSPGRGAPIFIYTNFIEDLVSHGYIVVGINYPYLSNPVEFSDDRVIKKMSIEELKKVWGVTTDDEVGVHEQSLWIADIQFVLDKLPEITMHADLTRIGLVGHSFGGGSSTQACAIDARCKAAVNIDGRFSYDPASDYGFNKPMLFIRSPHHSINKNTLENKNKKLHEQLKKMIYPAVYIEIPDMLHSSFGDIMLFIDDLSAWGKKIDVLAGVQQTRKLIGEFFNKQLV